MLIFARLEFHIGDPFRNHGRACARLYRVADEVGLLLVVTVMTDGPSSCSSVVSCIAREGKLPWQAKDLDDKDGNTLWRVVVFKSAAENFKKQCRERRYIVRDFEYSEEGYRRLKAQRDQLEDSVRRQHELVRGLYQAGTCLRLCL